MSKIACSEWIANLNKKHLEDLRNSGLSDETIFASKICSVDENKASTILGFQCSSSALCYPYLSPVLNESYRFKRVKPDITPLINGKPAKYLSPKGSINHLYIPQKVHAILENVSVRLVFTEGEKKALKATQEGIMCIGLSGVWGWKSKDRDNPDNESKPIPDLDLIKFENREVTIAFDSDSYTNPNIKQAAKSFAKELRKRGAIVEIKFFPVGPEGSKVGFDDFLLYHSPEDFWAIPSLDLDLPEKIKEIRLSIGLSNFQKRENISNVIIRGLIKRGYLLKTSSNELFYFDRIQNSLLELQNVYFDFFLSELSGLNSTESEFKYLKENLIKETSLRGSSADVHGFTFYNKKQNFLYVSDFGNFLYKLDGNSIKKLPNGTDGVLFKTDPLFTTYKLQSKIPSGKIYGCIIDKLNADCSKMESEKQKLLLYIYLLTLPFGSILPTRVLLCTIGEKGSGKTLIFKLVGRFLLGKNFNVFHIQKDKEDAFVAAICTYPFITYDNVDGNISWLNDQLARLATGQKIALRKLYKTNQIALYQPDTFVTLTSRTPKFKRDDVVERLLTLFVKPLEFRSPENLLLEELDSNRDEIWTEYLHALNCIIKKLPNIPHGQIKNHRMADFADLGFRIAKSIGCEEQFTNILNELAKIKVTFLLEEDPLLHALSVWIEQQASPNIKKTAAELYKELKTIFLDLGHSYEYNSALSLSKRLKNVGQDLASLLNIEFKIIHQTHNNQNTYQFKKKF